MLPGRGAADHRSPRGLGHVLTRGAQRHGDPALGKPGERRQPTLADPSQGEVAVGRIEADQQEAAALAQAPISSQIRFIRPT